MHCRPNLPVLTAAALVALGLSLQGCGGGGGTTAAPTPATTPVPTPAPTPGATTKKTASAWLSLADAAKDSELCKVGKACLKDPKKSVFYPGSTFFIDPEGMNSLQLLFSFLVYGYVLFISADMIGDGAELLLLVPGYDKMVGSIVLPILGAIPDGMMVLFSGVGPLEVAQENVAVGVGALAGSTIMLLTLPWILSVYAAQVDMDSSGECVGYKKPAGQRKTGKMGTGCCFQEGVTKNAYLMFLTSLSYFVIQIPAYLVDDQKTKAQYASESDYIDAVKKESKSENLWAIVGFGATMFFFAFYLYLQYLAAMEKEPPIAFLKKLLPPVGSMDMEKVKKFGVLPKIAHYRKNFMDTGRLRVTAEETKTPYGEAFINEENSAATKLPKDLLDPLRSLYTEYANKTPKDPGLNNEHMRELLGVIGLNYTPDAFNAKFEKFDKDNSKFLDRGEYLNMFYDLITDKAQPLPFQEASKKPDAADAGAAAAGDEEEDEMPDEFKDLPPEEQAKCLIRSSCKQMLIGTILVLIFSDPMVDVLAQIGKMTGVPPFYVSFVLAPLASNASELVSSYKLAARKTSSAITQSLQCLEGAACMNNTFCLSIFFILIFYQGLAWKFTAETLSIFFVQALVFLLVIKGNTQSMKEGVIIFMCYPLSLVFVYCLENYAGLD